MCQCFAETDSFGSKPPAGFDCSITQLISLRPFRPILSPREKIIFQLHTPTPVRSLSPSPPPSLSVSVPLSFSLSPPALFPSLTYSLSLFIYLPPSLCLSPYPSQPPPLKISLSPSPPSPLPSPPSPLSFPFSPLTPPFPHPSLFLSAHLSV